MKYRIIRGDIATDTLTREDYVEGEPIIIEGWEDISFFKRTEYGAIIISEVSTGRQCGDYYETEEEACKDVKKKFDRLAHKLVKKHIEAYISTSHVALSKRRK